MKKDELLDAANLLETFTHLVSIDNPPLKERHICDYLISNLNDLGFKVYEDDIGQKIGGNCGNLYAYLPGDETLKPLLFTSHMDSIEPSNGKKAIIHENGIITSDGSTVLGGDALTGVTAILEAVKTIKYNDLSHRPIEVIFFVAEELYGLGSTNFDYSQVKSKESYTLDLSGKAGTAAYKAPSLISVDIEIEGEAGHSGYNSDEYVHTIAIAAEAINKTKLGQIDMESTCNIGFIEGGFAPNMIPTSCRIKGEVRSFSHKKALSLANQMVETFREIAKRERAEIKTELKVRIRSYKTHLNHPVVKRFKKVCKKLNIPPELKFTLGGSDNNNIEQHGINGLVLATGVNKTHSCNEYSCILELQKITEIVIKLMTSKE